MKLSKRLKQIDSMVTAEYEHIWDCCCDHGFLGAALLNRQAGAKIHFVDIVPELMVNLTQKLTRFYRHLNTWQTHCIDVSLLPLSQHDGNHLVIIAGIGGDLMSDLVKHISKSHPDLDIEFLLCPVHHLVEMRQSLAELNLSLKAESLIEENGRYYEVIHVTNSAKAFNPISLTGELFWQTDCAMQARTNQQYLNKKLKHYMRIQAGNNASVNHIITAYQQLMPE